MSVPTPFPQEEPHWFLFLKALLCSLKAGISGAVPGEDLNGIWPFRCVFRVLVSLICGRQGSDSLPSAAGPDVSRGVPCVLLLLFWA